MSTHVSSWKVGILLAYWGSAHTIQLWINQTIQILELCPNLIQKPFLVPNQYMHGYNPMKLKVYVSNHEAQLLASHLRILMIKWGNGGCQSNYTLWTPLSRVFENICICLELQALISYYLYCLNLLYIYMFKLIFIMMISYSLSNMTTLRHLSYEWDDDT